MRAVRNVVLGAILLFILWMIVAAIASYFDGHFVPDGAVPNSWSPPDSWSEWRDILIVFTSIFYLIAAMLLVALLAALVFLVFLLRRILRENAVPALDSLKDTLDNVRGTTEFAGETVASPIIRTYAVVKGVRSGISAVTNLPDRIKRRRKQK